MARRRKNRTDFGRWLDLTLSNRRVLSRTLAEEMGVADSTVSKWRSGAATPPMEVVAQIATFLDLDKLRLAVTAGLMPPEIAGVQPYDMPEPTAERESVRKQISRIRGLSDEGVAYLLEKYDELTEQQEG